MEEQRQHTFPEILEECYDIHLELADISESYEILASDIEVVIEEINEHLEKVCDQIELVKKAFLNYSRRARQGEALEDPEESPFP